MFSLLLADVAIAFFARSVPQLNPFVLGFAVKILLGLMGLAASIRFSAAVFERLFGTTFRYWSELAAVPP
jgi:flagellar biosynthesis protein FliR